MIRGGYAGRLLEVDLTQGKVRPAPLPPEEILRQYIGCTGLGLYLLSREISPDMSPTDPHSPVFILTGPLTGTLAPNSSNWTILSLNAKVPYHPGISQSHGYFGARLKHAGWDGIVLRGASPKPVYLWVDNDKVELRDASRYWGMDTFETQRRIGLDHQDLETISVACIGPGGENLLPGASVRSDMNFGASMGAAGVVWGAKRLKAIAVRGSGKVPIAEYAAFVELCEKWKQGLTQMEAPPSTHEAEGLRLMPPFASWGRIPGKNFTDPEFPVEWGKRLAQCLPQWKVTPVGSWQCEHRCHNNTLITTGPMAGTTVMGYTGEVIEELGPNLGIEDPGVALALCGFVDGLGLAASEVPRTIAMVMEAYNQGRLSRERLDGIDITWGNYEAVIELLQKTLRREGIGATIAQGLRPAAQELGIEDIAVHMKGGGFNDHEPRACPPYLFQSLVVSGAGPTWQMQLMSLLTTEPDLGWNQAMDPLKPEMAFIEALSGGDYCAWHIKKMWEDTPGTCFFATRGVKGILELVPQAIVAAVGWEGFNRQEAWAVGERVVNLQRLISLYRGYRPEYDFDISPRLLEPLRSGPARGMGVSPALLKRWRQEFYQALGWDPDTGLPRPEALQKVGLADYRVGKL